MARAAARLPTLTAALDRILRHNALALGYRLGQRRMVNIERAGGQTRATLILSWYGPNGEAAIEELVGAEPDLPACAGPYGITVDLTDLPKGIEVEQHSRLHDTCVGIQPPCEAEVLAAARRLGCATVDRGISTGGDLVYYVLHAPPPGSGQPRGQAVAP